ncbi:MAG: pantetheine-phosphate adenylyltransferase [candidate division Zixibacteria bacterium]|nr:pantetheine-phosphate adenylyltransferase [candidate division Zixibacteria bacterium]
MRTALYPGTFDPVTHGHTDIVDRALAMFDRLIVAVANNTSKSTTFSVQQRLELLKAVIGDKPEIEIVEFNGLTAHYAKERDVAAIIRGLRAVSDFEYEFQMALMNRRLVPEVETVFLMPRGKYAYLSSTLIKDVARFGGEVDLFVGEPVAKMLREKLKNEE